MGERRSVTVRIRGKEFRIRSDEEDAALQRIAAYVDRTMEQVEKRTGTVDSLDVAMLTALNLAREVLETGDVRAHADEHGERLRALIELAESAVVAESH